MSAVDLTRLRFQVEELTRLFHSPRKFHQKLTDLFSLYANRNLRFGDSTQVRPLVPMYHLPDPVIRQITQDIKPYLSEDPEMALDLADELWEDQYFVVRQVAIFILGRAPTQEAEPVRIRLEKWLTPELDQALTSILLTNGTSRFQESFPQAWESFIESFLKKEKPKLIALGFRSLKEGFKTSKSMSLPSTFRLISPFIRRPQSVLINDLRDLIEVLAKHSPTETAYFLRQNLSISDSDLTLRLVKQCLPFFSEDIQEVLKSSIRK